jgi:hypothetical protein
MFTNQQQTGSANLRLSDDIMRDAGILASTSVYISDSSTPSPSLQTVDSDLELFLMMSRLDMAQSRHSHSRQGKHQVHSWRFDEGTIKAIHQIETTMALDTVVTQRYLENRAPTEQRIQNNFRFRTYAVSTTDALIKLYYLTEIEQGLLEYKIDDRHVELVYTKKKQGLSDVMPKVKDELDQLIVRLSKE